MATKLKCFRDKNVDVDMMFRQIRLSLKTEAYIQET